MFTLMQVYLYFYLVWALYSLGLRYYMHITLHGGPEKWQKRGRPLRVLYHFCLIKLKCVMAFDVYFVVPLSYFYLGDFLFVVHLFLFTVHIRLVLSPCQAGNTIFYQ